MQAIVVPPAGSVRIPSVRPSRSIASKISGSEAVAAQPPRVRTASITRLPSPGAPIAIECAAVSGTCGSSSPPPRIAVAIGEQPLAWAMLIFVPAVSARPTVCSSFSPLWTREERVPPAAGITMWSGETQSSCSTTSKAIVFAPSA